MSKKLFIAYIFYIAAMIGIYSKWGLNLIDGSPLRLIAGIVVFIMLTAVIIALTVYFVKANKALYLKSLGDGKKKTETERLADFITYFSGIERSSGHKDILDIAQTCTVAAKRMTDKLEQLRKLLGETFSLTDLTYTSYIESLNEITAMFNNNLNGIRKRIDVFDPSDVDSDVSSIYLSESAVLEERNEKMLDTMDNLLLELVRVEDVNDNSLAKLNQLIEQTKLYQETEEY